MLDFPIARAQNSVTEKMKVNAGDYLTETNIKCENVRCRMIFLNPNVKGVVLWNRTNNAAHWKHQTCHH